MSSVEILLEVDGFLVFSGEAGIHVALSSDGEDSAVSVFTIKTGLSHIFPSPHGRPGTVPLVPPCVPGECQDAYPVTGSW